MMGVSVEGIKKHLENVVSKYEEENNNENKLSLSKLIFDILNE
jgi:hypothetical protein